MQRNSYLRGVSLVWLQVVLFGGWGAHTSQNDLVAPEEKWHRFYSMGGGGIRFLVEKRLQPGLMIETGRFISQDRQQSRFAQTRWATVGVLLRYRPFRFALSPVGEVCAFRLTAAPRSADERPIPGIPASISANGIGWSAGLSWRLSPYGEVALVYLRRRPQTQLLDGFAGPARDRIEGLMGQLALSLLPPPSNRSRF